MSGAGRESAPQFSGFPIDADIVIIAGNWHRVIRDGLIAGASRACDRAGVSYRVIFAPGCFEIPLIADAALRQGADAVIALGVIIRGGTPHFEYISQGVTEGLTRVAIDNKKPVGFGILTLDDEAQGIDRAGFEHSKENKGEEAADAVLSTLTILSTLRE